MKFYTLLAILAGCNFNKVPPEEAAKKFAAELHLDLAGASCTQSDTDHDGYVTCTVSFDLGSDVPPLLAKISCAPLGGETGGCKASDKEMERIMAAKVHLKRPPPPTMSK